MSDLSLNRLLNSISKYKINKEKNEYQKFLHTNDYQINMLLEIINNYQMNSKSDILNIMNYNDFCYFLFKHQKKIIL